MTHLDRCPSTLKEGFDTYSPDSSILLFGCRKVSPWLNFSFEDSHTGRVVFNEAMNRISVSGVQEKFPALVENGIFRPHSIRNVKIRVADVRQI